MIDLPTLQASPRAFRDCLLIDTDHGPRRFKPDAWQAADFAAIDEAWRRVASRVDAEPQFQRAYLERPRGHSKTTDIAAMTTYALIAAPKNSPISGVAAAGDADQARLIRNAIAKLVAANHWLARALDVQQWKVVNRHTGSELTIISSDAGTSYGLTPDFIVCDEIVHWRSRDLWDSLLSAAAKRARCLLLIISNAGYGDTWQWQTREAIRTDPAWYFSRLDGPQASWLSADALAEQRRLLPAIAYARLWLNQWSTGSGDAFDDDDLQRCLTLAAPFTAVEPGWIYTAGVDLGVSRDAACVAVVARHAGWVEEIPVELQLTARQRVMIDAGFVDAPDETPEYRQHPGSGAIRLGEVRIWRPTSAQKVDLAAVESTIAKLHRRFNFAFVASDPWQAESMVQRLQAGGVPIEAVPQSPANLQLMASTLLDAVRDKQLELYSHADLLADLRRLRVIDRAGGFRLESPTIKKPDVAGTRHGDAASALQLALLAARRSVEATPRTVDRDLILWP